MKRHLTLALGLTLAAGGISSPAFAHGGGLNAEGCHNDRKGGTGYHCHRGSKPATSSNSGSAARPLGLSAAGASGGAYANCTEARAAGASNIRRGEPAYGPHLDRDGDGVGCER
jgi:hypothetical protein